MDKVSKRSAIGRPLALATGAVSLATLLAYGGRWSWACELLVNFRTHFALLLGSALIVAALMRRWRIAAVAALALALNVWPMAGVLAGAGPATSPGVRPLRVVEFNVYVDNRDLAGVAAYLESLAPDVIVLEEVTAASADELTRMLPRWRYRHLAVDEGVRGVMMLSRWPLIEPRRVTHEGRMFGVRADVDLGDRRLRLYGVHLDWPLVPRSERVRNAQLATLGHELSQCAGACAVVGDFNTTPWSSRFQELLGRSGFRDCAAGRGWRPTWPAGLPAPLRIRIDHCLVSAAVAVAGVQVGQSAGSDHLATINEWWVASVMNEGAPRGAR